MNTRKYPRTLDEAFGSKDYCDPIEQPTHNSDRIVLWACGIAAVVMVALAVMGVVQ